MNTTISQIRIDLKKRSDEKTREGAKRFFKESIQLYGVKTAITTQIGKKYFKEIKHKNKSEIFSMCEELWKSGYIEESFIACHWSYAIHKKYERNDLKLFEKWISHHVTNWASCDTFCNHTVGEFIEMFPEDINVLKKWASSKNRWMKRAAAVSLIVPAKNGKFLNDVFEIADLLITDADDMVQKG
jgi:3-methyladenine DNA glycosylase AlkD